MSDQRDPRTYAIIGACMEVHKELGHRFLEAVYQEALQYEFTQRSLPFAREVPLPIRYKETVLQCVYKADFICYESVIVELKALSQLTTVEYDQIINYLKATGMQWGLLINFGAPSLKYKRFIRSADYTDFADKNELK